MLVVTALTTTLKRDFHTGSLQEQLIRSAISELFNACRQMPTCCRCRRINYLILKADGFKSGLCMICSDPKGYEEEYYLAVPPKLD